LVVQAPGKMHLFLVVVKRQVFAQLLGFQVMLDTEEDFLSCAQREKETVMVYDNDLE
jgi:hypothetical protein